MNLVLFSHAFHTAIGYSSCLVMSRQLRLDYGSASQKVEQLWYRPFLEQRVTSVVAHGDESNKVTAARDQLLLLPTNC